MDPLVSLAELSTSLRPSAQVGGKAANLARLLAAGLPVPPGYLVGPNCTVDDRLCTQITRELPGPYVVRSSAPFEDTEYAAAAGVFLSRRDVVTDTLLDAIVEVQDSATAPAARAYLTSRGLDAITKIPVVVQSQVTGQLATVYTQPVVPSAGEDELYLEIPTENISMSLPRLGRAPTVGESLPLDMVESIRAAATQAERAIDAPAGADVEFVLDRTLANPRVFVVQARPIPIRRNPSVFVPASTLADTLGDETVWTWDVTHNPQPLSPAQASVVAWLMDNDYAPYPIRTIAGYLYSGTEVNAEPRSRVAPHIHTESDLRALYDTFTQDWRARFENLEPGNIDLVLSRYGQFYQSYCGHWSQTLRRAKDALADFLVAENIPPAHLGREQAHNCAKRVLPTPRSYIGTQLGRASRGELTFAELLRTVGAFSPQWDISSPSYGESIDILRGILAGWRAYTPARLPEYQLETVLSRGQQQRYDQAYLVSKAGFELGELDDVFFAHAQLYLRRAWLAVARDRGIPVDIAFWLALPDLLTLAPPDAINLAEQERKRYETSCRYAMPIAVCNGRPLELYAGQNSSQSLRGLGSGGSTRAPVYLYRPPTQIPAGGIAVARSFAPSDVVALRSAAGLISEYGGLLDHAASLARELGIPYLSGCRGACDYFETGDVVYLDCDAGYAHRTDPAVIPDSQM